MASSFGRIRSASQLPGTLGCRCDLHQGGPVVSTTAVPDSFTTLPDEHALQATVTALEELGLSVEVVGDLDAARRAVLARIPDASPVMTSASVTLAETGLADAINDGGGRWGSAPNTMFALDFPPRARELKTTGGQPPGTCRPYH